MRKWLGYEMELGLIYVCIYVAAWTWELARACVCGCMHSCERGWGEDEGNCHSAELQFLADACYATSRATSKSELMMRTRLNALCSCSHFPERCELPAGGQPRGGSGCGATWREGDSAVQLWFGECATLLPQVVSRQTRILPILTHRGIIYQDLQHFRD